jgi:hypothetical protein
MAGFKPRGIGIAPSPLVQTAAEEGAAQEGQINDI